MTPFLPLSKVTLTYITCMCVCAMKNGLWIGVNLAFTARIRKDILCSLYECCHEKEYHVLLLYVPYQGSHLGLKGKLCLLYIEHYFDSAADSFLFTVEL